MVQIGVRFSKEIADIIDTELINKRRLGNSRANLISNIVLKWLADEGYIKDPPGVMVLLEQVKRLEAEKQDKYLSPSEVIDVVEKMKRGEVVKVTVRK